MRRGGTSGADLTIKRPQILDRDLGSRVIILPLCFFRTDYIEELHSFQKGPHPSLSPPSLCVSLSLSLLHMHTTPPFSSEAWCLRSAASGSPRGRPEFDDGDDDD